MMLSILSSRTSVTMTIKLNSAFSKTDEENERTNFPPEQRRRHKTSGASEACGGDTVQEGSHHRSNVTIPRNLGGGGHRRGNRVNLGLSDPSGSPVATILLHNCLTFKLPAIGSHKDALL